MKSTRKKKLLFVINTLGRGGAEQALLHLLDRIDPAQYEIDLYVLLGQGELIAWVPGNVRILNRQYTSKDVLSSVGRTVLAGTILKDCFRHRALLENLDYIRRNGSAMLHRHSLQTDKLLWKMVSDAADIPQQTYDLAVAFLEGGSTYYVADHVKARRKAVFIHVDYRQAGYTRMLDHGCYQKMDRIYCVSKDNRDSFLEVYPELAAKTEVFYLSPDPQEVKRKADFACGFTDGFGGVRILTVARLVKQKCLDVSIHAMALYEKMRQKPGSDLPEVRWYVLGEGDERRHLEEEIRKMHLQDKFVLMGVKDNPYPFYRQADLYVHCTGYEGRSIALQEAMLLGRPVIASDCSGNRELIRDGENGLLVPLSPQTIEKAVAYLVRHPGEASRLGTTAAKNGDSSDSVERILALCDEQPGCSSTIGKCE